MLGTVEEEALMFIYMAYTSTLSDLEYITFLTDVFTIHVFSILSVRAA